MANSISFQGLSSNLPTDQLINAIMTQESQPMVRMQAQQAKNNTKSAALATIRLDLTSLNTSMGSLTGGGFQARTVTSSDSTGADVTATSSGGAAGAYDVAVTNVATRARMLLPATGGVLPTAAVGLGAYDLTDINGKTAVPPITLSAGNNTLLGLRDAINSAKDASGKALEVTATIIQTGADGKSQLVLSSTNTGKGDSGASTFSLSGPVGNTLGLPTSAAPLSSSAAVNAKFTLNGVEMERTSNTVTDAVDGVAFNLKVGGSGKTTTLTVGLDKAAITSALQDVVSKYNQLYKDYKSRTTSTTATDGTVTAGVFTNDPSIRGMITQMHTAIMGAPTGLSADAAFTAPSGVGLKTNRDGTLALDTAAFQAALDKDPQAVSNVFGNSGTSTSPLLSFLGASSATANTPISFTLGQPDGTGLVTGTFTTTPVGGTAKTSTITSSNGYFYGATGTPFEGLSLKASPGATGTLNVSKGVGQAVQDLVRDLTSTSSGNIGSILQNITAQNNSLTSQINTQQSRLERRKTTLQKIYANLEMTVGQLSAAGQSISSMQ